jgi:hypothetical protein
MKGGGGSGAYTNKTNLCKGAGLYDSREAYIKIDRHKKQAFSGK